MEAIGGYVMRLVSSGNNGEERIILNHYRCSPIADYVRLEVII